VPRSTRLVRVLCARIHPLILKESQIQAGEEYGIHTTSADEGLLSRTFDRIRPDIILLDLLQNIIWCPILLCGWLSGIPGYSMGSRRKVNRSLRVSSHLLRGQPVAHCR
jgi:hypothetical protein